MPSGGLLPLGRNSTPLYITATITGGGWESDLTARLAGWLIEWRVSQQRACRALNYFLTLSYRKGMWCV